MKKYLLALVALFPLFASAQTLGESDFTVNNIPDLLNLLQTLIRWAIPVIIALAVLVFIWGVFLYVVKDSDEEKSKGKKYMLWGIIGIFVMVSVWGLVNILVNTFNLQTEAPDVPKLPQEVQQ